MIVQKNQNTGGLVIKASLRSAGQMEKDGKIIAWDEAFQISILPFEEDRKIVKYNVDPACVGAITQKLDSVHWGCLIELELKNKKVVSVEIVDDVLKGFYEESN